MIILYSKNATISRVPKTGSTTLESSIRFSPGCFADGDRSASVDDSGIPPINVSDYEAVQSSQRTLNHSIRDKRDNSPNDYTAEEQAHITFRQNQIQNNSFKRIPLPHSTVSDLVDTDSWGDLNYLTTSQLESFNHYAFIRNPLERILSGFLFVWHVRRNHRVPLEVSMFHDHINSDEFGTGLVYRKQIDYFKHEGTQIVTPMLFENYENEMNNLITTLGGAPLREYPKFKSNLSDRFMLTDPKPSVENWIEPYSDIKDKILNHYSEDVTLWQNTSGQTL